MWNFFRRKVPKEAIATDFHEYAQGIQFNAGAESFALEKRFTDPLQFGAHAGQSTVKGQLLAYQMPAISIGANVYTSGYPQIVGALVVQPPNGENNSNG